jgi:hypothetical protein
MVLDAPQRIEAQRLREIAKMQIVAIDLAIVAGIGLALKDNRGSYVHGGFLWLGYYLKPCKRGNA